MCYRAYKYDEAQVVVFGRNHILREFFLLKVFALENLNFYKKNLLLSSHGPFVTLRVYYDIINKVCEKTKILFCLLGVLCLPGFFHVKECYSLT